MTKKRLYDPRQKARSSLKRRDFEIFALCSLFANRRRPFYRRHILYTCPAYRILAFLIKHMLPVKRIFTAASHKRMRLTTSFYSIGVKYSNCTIVCWLTRLIVFVIVSTTLSERFAFIFRKEAKFRCHLWL